MKSKKKISIDYKRIIYTLCMLLLCGVAFTRAAGNGDWWNLAVNCVGFCLFPVIVMRFGIKSFMKIPFGIWLLLGTPVSLVLIGKFYYSATHRMAFAALVIEALLYGLIIIRIIYGFIKKDILKRLSNLNPLFYVCLAFFILCAVSVSEALWPIYLGVVFISFYLSFESKKDDELFFVSLSDALIISFFLIQSFAFLHRPYDQTRYVGAYTNSNVNGMFYYAVYLGWLSKYSYLRKKGKPKWIGVIHFLFAAAMWSFALLTMSRSVLLAFVVTTVIYFIMSEVIILRYKFVKGFLLNGVLMFLVFVISFPIVFSCVRYIPALRHHPIWITEYSEDFVHSYDPWNSEKYVEMDEFFGTLIGRFDPENVDSRNTDVKKEEVLLEERNASPDSLSKTLETEEDTPVINEKDGRVISYPDGVLPGSDKDHPAYTFEEYKGVEKIFGIRKYIFGYYFRNLNLFGHKEEYPFAYILPWFDVPHAHNSYLQTAYCFGIPAGIILLGISLFACVYPFVFAVKNKRETPWYFTFVCVCQVGILMISITENIALPGKMLFSLLFITLLPLMYKKVLEEKTVKQYNNGKKNIAGNVKGSGKQSVNNSKGKQSANKKKSGKKHKK